MKASEMTNEELANTLECANLSSWFNECFFEAAARLRKAALAKASGESEVWK